MNFSLLLSLAVLCGALCSCDKSVKDSKGEIEAMQHRIEQLERDVAMLKAQGAPVSSTQASTPEAWAQKSAAEATALRYVGQTIFKYSLDHGDRLPPSLEALVPKYLRDPSELTSPHASTPVEVSYNYLLANKETTDIEAPTTTVVAISKYPSPSGARMALFADFHVAPVNRKP